MNKIGSTNLSNVQPRKETNKIFNVQAIRLCLSYYFLDTHTSAFILVIKKVSTDKNQTSKLSYFCNHLIEMLHN